MRGFLTLDPDEATHARLVVFQNRLRNALTRQGVSFPDRLAPVLLAWPFATLGELDEAASLVAPCLSNLMLAPLHGNPNDDRPAEVGLRLRGAEAMQSELGALLKQTLDPDLPKPPFVRLVRVSPPSRKVGAALRASGLLGMAAGEFVPQSLSFWRQTPQGFDVHRSLRPGSEI